MKEEGNTFIAAISFALLALGYFESVLAILQWLGVAVSHHPAYPYTGTFYNPGPFACFLSIVVPAAVYAADNSCHRLTNLAATGMVLLGAILIPATLSRTAMLAAAAGCAVALWGRIKPCVRRVPKGWSATAAIAFAVALAALYVVKKDSADGRLLMWKVAAEAAADVPPNGVGWDRVAGAYGDAQERYFASGRGSEDEKMVADAPEYVFNEYLQVAIAFGPFAAMMMVAAVGGGIAVALKNGNRGLAGCGVAAAIVMAASYPLQFPLSALTIGVVTAGCWWSAAGMPVRIGGSVAAAAMCALFIANSEKTDVEADFSVALALNRQGNHEKSNSMLAELRTRSADPMILNIIGKNYKALGMPDSAEHYFRKSATRCPNRMYPHYLLMRLYADSAYADPVACWKEAATILSMKVKINSPAVGTMRREAEGKMKIEK